jgi:2-polyprenyl-6-methoxyphenol 4-hydroxylase
MLREVDIAIIGGGMVGASLAALLPANLKVMVIESYPLPAATNGLPEYRPSYDARSSALSYSTYDIFRKAGIWPVLQQWVQPIHQVHVSDRGYWGSTLLSDQQENMQALGYVVENAWLGKALLHVLQQKPNVDFCCPATVEKLRPINDGAELQIRKGDETEIVHARLAVVADGARSAICQALGIHIETSDYGHTAIVANVTTSEPHKGIAYERFTDSGPMALLPLMDENAGSCRSALIWTMPAREASVLEADDEPVFLKKLQARFGYRQGQFLKVGQRHAYPLMLSTAAEQVRRNIVVLGNAAHSLHPVAGQGFNLALRDVQALCQVLEDAARQQLPLGDLAHLQRYAALQKNDQQLTTVFSDVLPQLFARKQRIIAAGRGLGLVGMELMPGLKSSFVRFATGIRSGV